NMRRGVVAVHGFHFSCHATSSFLSVPVGTDASKRTAPKGLFWPPNSPILFNFSIFYVSCKYNLWEILAISAVFPTFYRGFYNSLREFDRFPKTVYSRLRIPCGKI